MTLKIVNTFNGYEFPQRYEHYEDAYLARHYHKRDFYKQPSVENASFPLAIIDADAYSELNSEGNYVWRLPEELEVNNESIA